MYNINIFAHVYYNVIDSLKHNIKESLNILENTFRIVSLP